jgi:hypothetical protein
LGASLGPLIPLLFLMNSSQVIFFFICSKEGSALSKYHFDSLDPQQLLYMASRCCRGSGIDYRMF